MNGNYIVQPGEASAVQQDAAQIAQQQPTAPRWTDSARLVGNTARITLSGGSETVENVENVKQSEYGELTQRDPSGGILSTARSTFGRPVAGTDVRPNSIVKVGGMETSVAAAVAAGLLQRNGDGSYSETGDGSQVSSQAPQEPQQPQEQQQQDPAATKVEDLPQQLHEYAQDFCSRVDNVTVTSAVNALINGGDLSDNLVGQIAGQMQLEPGEVRGRTDQIRAAYTEQAYKMVGEHAQAIFDYANAHEPRALQAATQKHVTQEDPRAYDEVVRSFWLNLDRYAPAAILSANNAKDVGARRESNGSITVELKGYPRMSWQAAVRAGLIAPSRNAAMKR